MITYNNNMLWFYFFKMNKNPFTNHIQIITKSTV